MNDTASNDGTWQSIGAGSPGPAPGVIISANALWNIHNFRLGLIDALVSRGYRVVIAVPEPAGRWAQEKGVDSAAIEMDRAGLSPLRDAKLFLDYLRLFGKYPSRFYLGFTVKPNIYGAMAARLKGITPLPNVSGLGTAFISEGLLSKFVGVLYRLAFRGCPIVFFQNSDDRDLFVARGILRPEQCRLLPGSGVDLERFEASDQEPSQITFLFVGRLLGDKGVREFIEAAAMLRDFEPNWRFQLLGPFDEGNRTAIGRDELKRWTDTRVVEYLGATDDVRPFVASSTVVVLPSYREGLPRSLLEAAAMARPLIASDVPGNRQVVHDGVNGLLCAPRNSKSLADAMLAMGGKSASERRSMGQEGRRLVENSFGEERVISAYLDAMAQLASCSGV